MVTVTSTMPVVTAGVTAVSWVAESTVKVVAGVVPKSTSVVPVRSVPTTSTVSPPAVEPMEASTAVTTGPLEAPAGTVSTTMPARPTTRAAATVGSRRRHVIAGRRGAAGVWALVMRPFSRCTARRTVGTRNMVIEFPATLRAVSRRPWAA